MSADNNSPPAPVHELSVIFVSTDRFEVDEIAAELSEKGHELFIVSSKNPTMASLLDPSVESHALLGPQHVAEKLKNEANEIKAALDASREEAAAAAESEELASEQSKS